MMAGALIYLMLVLVACFGMGVVVAGLIRLRKVGKELRKLSPEDPARQEKAEILSAFIYPFW